MNVSPSYWCSYLVVVENIIILVPFSVNNINMCKGGGGGAIAPVVPPLDPPLDMDTP